MNKINKKKKKENFKEAYKNINSLLAKKNR